MRALRRLARPAVATTAAVLLLAGCGGDDGDDGSFTRPSTTASTTTASPAPTGADAQTAAFCQQAQAFAQSAGELQNTDPRQYGPAIQQIVTTFDAIQPPAALVADWQVVGTALHELADTADSLDLSTPAGLTALQQAFQEFAGVFQSPQGRNVSDYVTTNCIGG